MKEASHKGSLTVSFHLCEMSKIGLSGDKKVDERFPGAAGTGRRGATTTGMGFFFFWVMKRFWSSTGLKVAQPHEYTKNY